MILHIQQINEQKVGKPIELTEKEISSEPNFRRVNPDFAWRHGGEIVKMFLRSMDGNLSDRTRILVRRTPFQNGFHPSAPDFHPDTIPGLPAQEIILLQKYPMQIHQGVFFQKDRHPDDTGSVFLKGTVTLDTSMETKDKTYSGVSHVDRKEGFFHWYHSQIIDQLNDGTLEEYSLPGNQIHRYSSVNFHRCPQLYSTGGSRLLIRVDNPHPEDPIETGSIPSLPEIAMPIKSVYEKISKDRWIRLDP